jgi:hypothetical protein
MYIFCTSPVHLFSKLIIESTHTWVLVSPIYLIVNFKKICIEDVKKNIYSHSIRDIEMIVVQLLYNFNNFVFEQTIVSVFRDLILVQHQYNNCTTTPHIRVGPSMWDPPSCEGLLYNCCIGVVNLTLHVGPTYPIVDFKKKKKFVGVVQEL